MSLFSCDYHKHQFDEFISKGRRTKKKTTGQFEQEEHERFSFDDHFSVEVQDGAIGDWWTPAYVDVQYNKDGLIQSLSFRHCTFSVLPTSLETLAESLETLSLESLQYLEGFENNSILRKLKKLSSLEIIDCPSIRAIHPLPENLVSLQLRSLEMKSLPVSLFRKMRKLKYLSIKSMYIEDCFPTLPQSLEELHVSNCFDWNKQLLLSNLVSHLEGNLNLRTLATTMCDLEEHDMIFLWTTVVNCSNLRHLDLSDNLISTLSLDSLLEVMVERPTKIRRLNLESNPVIHSCQENESTSLSRIILANKELYCIGGRDEEVCWPLLRKSQFNLDRNFYRISMEGGNSIPPSIWPVIIANINCLDFPHEGANERKASMIFDILQGPAFGGRLTSTHS